MDNIITGAIGVIIFMAFVLGLAESISKLPFVIIVGSVCAMQSTDFFESARDSLRDMKQKTTGTAE